MCTLSTVSISSKLPEWKVPTENAAPPKNCRGFDMFHPPMPFQNHLIQKFHDIFMVQFVVSCRCCPCCPCCPCCCCCCCCCCGCCGCCPCCGGCCFLLLWLWLLLSSCLSLSLLLLLLLLLVLVLVLVVVESHMVSPFASSIFRSSKKHCGGLDFFALDLQSSSCPWSTGMARGKLNESCSLASLNQNSLSSKKKNGDIS